MSNRWDRRGSNFDYSNRRDAERSPRDRDRERDWDRGRDPERDRGRDRDDRDRRFRERSPPRRSLESPNNNTWRDTRPPPPTGPAAAKVPAVTKAPSNGEPSLQTGVEKQLVDQLYATYGYLAKQASLRTTHLDLEQQVKTLAAEREDVLQTRFDDYPSVRESLQRRQDAVEAQQKRNRQDLENNKSTFGKLASDFVGTLLAHFPSQQKQFEAPSANHHHHHPHPAQYDLGALERKLEARLAAHEEKTKAQESTITKQDEQIAILVKTSREQGQVISQQKQELASCRSDAQSLRSELQSAQLLVQTLESEIRETNSEPQTLKTESQTFETESQILKSGFQTLETAFQTLKTEFGTLETGFRALQTESERLGLKVAAYDFTVENLTSGHATMQGALDKLEASRRTDRDDAVTVVKVDASEQFAAFEKRLQDLSDFYEQVPMSMIHDAVECSDVHIPDLQSQVKTLTDAIQELKSRTPVAQQLPAPLPAAPAASEADLRRLDTALEQLRLDTDLKISRKELQDSMNSIKADYGRSFMGLTNQFGSFIDEHDNRLTKVEAVVSQHGEGAAGQSDMATQATEAAPAAGKPEAAAEAITTSTADSATSVLKQDLEALAKRVDISQSDINAVKEMMESVRAAFGAMHQRQEDAHMHSLNYQRQTSEMIEALQHAIHNLSHQFNNLSTEDVCKRILHYVSGLSTQKATDDLTRRFESLEKAVHGIVGANGNGNEQGTSKKRKSSSQVRGGLR